MKTPRYLLALVCSFALLVTRAYSLTADEIATHLEIHSWTTNIKTSGPYELTFYVIEGGLEKRLWGSSGNGESAATMMISPEIGRYRFSVHRAKESDLSKTTTSVSTSTELARFTDGVVTFVPLPKNLEDGDYLLFGESKDPKISTDSENIKDYAKAVFVRFKKKS